MLCATCGFENDDGESVCLSCGSSLGDSPLPSAAPALGSYAPGLGSYAPGLGSYAPGLAGYAGFWKRFAASFIDGIVVGIVRAGIACGLGMPLIVGYSRSAGDSLSVRLTVFYLFGLALNLIVSWLYWTLLESSAQQATLGKLAVGIVVTDMDGKRISFGKANARYWCKLLSYVIFCIGFIMAGFTKKKQALHDLIAGTLVLNKPSP